jgi:hypothetical protein
LLIACPGLAVDLTVQVEGGKVGLGDVVALGPADRVLVHDVLRLRPLSARLGEDGPMSRLI